MCEVLWYAGVPACCWPLSVTALPPAWASHHPCPHAICPCSVLGNGRGRLPVTGSDFCRLTYHMHTHSVALLVSQSGQT